MLAFLVEKSKMKLFRGIYFLRIREKTLKSNVVVVFVVVQFDFWFNLDFLLFYIHYHILA